jgi:hypothetical protein
MLLQMLILSTALNQKIWRSNITPTLPPGPAPLAPRFDAADHVGLGCHHRPKTTNVGRSINQVAAVPAIRNINILLSYSMLFLCTEDPHK